MFKQIFESKFISIEYFIENVLKPIFDGKATITTGPSVEEEVDISSQASQKIYKSLNKVAEISSSQAGEIFVYEAIVNDNIQINRTRVNIQSAIRSKGFFDNAFIITHYEHNQEDTDWRFSYVKSEGSGKFTNAKRYTYSFGKNHRCRTANQRFTELQKQPLTKESLLDAFGVEALSNEFFYKVLAFYSCFEKYITGKESSKVSSIKDTSFTQQYKILDSLNLKSTNNQFEKSFDSNEKNARNYIKKMIGRIIFLCFLEKKGLLKNKENNPFNFLDSLITDYQDKQEIRDDFLEQVLEPLFFGFLNTKYEDREREFRNNNNLAISDVRGIKYTKWDFELIKQWNIPYLNGGLFDRSIIDKKRVVFPFEYFKMFFELLKEYNFTIDENDTDDAEVGVDPEMLSKIFENLLEDNKDKGAFYTPKEIVDYMCKQSLIAYLNTKCNREDYQKYVEALVNKNINDDIPVNFVNVIRKALEKVTICDPAIGSGAFPMGMLNILYKCHVLLYDERTAEEIKKDIIQHNIYGVDIERGAVDIARLRFWLSLVIVQEKPTPLPNLDFKIIQGNSLLESYCGIDLSKIIDNIRLDKPKELQKDLFGNYVEAQTSINFNQDSGKNLSNLLDEFYTIDDHEEKAKKKESIYVSVKTALSKAIQSNIDLLTKKKKDLSQKIVSESNTSIDLQKNVKSEIDRKKIIEKTEKEIAKLQSKLNEIQQELDYYKKGIDELNGYSFGYSELPFFLWHTWFADVFDKGGFDIVIGNPPYGVSIKGDYRSNVVNSIGNVPDYEIYYYFIEIAKSLVKNNGILSYIVPNTWLFNTFANKYRINLFLCWNLLEVLDCSMFKIFESAEVRNSIFIFQKSKNSQDVYYRPTMNANSFPQLVNEPLLHLTQTEILKMNQNWGLAFKLSPESINLVNKITDAVNQMSHFFDCSQGYIPYRLSDLVREYGKIEGTKIKNGRLWHSKTESDIFWIQELYGRDISKYAYSPTGEYVNYGEHVATYVDMKYFSGKRVVVREITNPSIIACIVDDTLLNDPQLLPLKQKTNDCPYSYEFIWALLNSKLATFYHFNHSPKATKGSFPKILIQDLKEFPLPEVTEEEQAPIITLVDKILKAKKDNPSANTRKEENEIDEIVYNLYGLSEEEKNIIDPERIK